MRWQLYYAPYEPTATQNPVTCNQATAVQKRQGNFSNSQREAISDLLSKIELRSQCDLPLVVRRNRLAG